MVAHTGEFRDRARSSRGTRLSTWPGLARPYRHNRDCGSINHPQFAGRTLESEVCLSASGRENLARVNSAARHRLGIRDGGERGRSCDHRVDGLTFATTPVEKVRTVTTS